MGPAIVCVCDFPGCDVHEKRTASTGQRFEPTTWMVFEAPWLCYERFCFCPTHREQIEAQHAANAEAVQMPGEYKVT